MADPVDGREPVDGCGFGRVPAADTPVVRVSDHAVEQAQARFGAGWSLRRIRAEVTAAIVDGRVSKRAPGTFYNGRLRLRHGGRLCSSLDGRRVYLIKRVRSRRDGRRYWVVITAIRPDHIREQEAA